MKRFAAAAVLIAMACSREVSPPKQRDHVTLNLNPSMTYAPLMIAKDEGFFAAEGIDAELVSLDSNSALAALTAGKLDVLSAGVRSGIFNMILKGVPIQIVADRSHSTPGPCAFDAFVAPTDMAKRIAAAGGSLRGERVAVVRGGTAEYLTEKLLERAHTSAADVVLVQMPQGSLVAGGGKIDAVRFIGEPHLSALVADGSTRIIATIEELAPGVEGTVLVYGKRLLRDDADLGRRVMRAYLRGVRRYNEGKTERNVAIIARYTKLPADVVRRSCWVSVANDGRVDPRAVQPFLDWALAKHYLDAPVPADRWWNPAFVDAANRAMQ